MRDSASEQCWQLELDDQLVGLAVEAAREVSFTEVADSRGNIDNVVCVDFTASVERERAGDAASDDALLEEMRRLHARSAYLEDYARRARRECSAMREEFGRLREMHGDQLAYHLGYAACAADMHPIVDYLVDQVP